MILLAGLTIAFVLGVFRVKDALVDLAARDFRRDARVGRALRNFIILVIGAFALLLYLKLNAG